MRQLIPALMMGALLAGCGGGGGKTASPTTAQAVSARQAAMMVTFKAGDASGFMAFVADSYADPDGLTKATLAPLVTEDFHEFDTLALSLTAQQWLVSSDGTQAIGTLAYRITDHDKALGDTQTSVMNWNPTWSRIGGNWFATRLARPVYQTQAPGSKLPWRRR